VKFEAKIDKPDKTLPEQFRAEEAKSYILNWALEGLSMYQENRKEYGKIQEPEIVTKWNKQYRANEDLLLQFIEDYCNVFSQAETTQSLLRLVYEEWAENNGYHPMTAIALGKSLDQRGFTRKSSNGVRFWCGIEVRKDKLPRVEELSGTRNFADERFQRKLPGSHFEWWEKYEREKEEGKRFQWEGTPF
jgi:putative DNA primase/helicase